MSITENAKIRRTLILLIGLLAVPISYVMDSLVKSDHPFYQAWIILSVALWVIISGVTYFVFLSLRLRNGTFPRIRPPR